ncbi:MAG TPA: glycosyl transferase family 1 [Candidatus Atribacteria bacterium]|nr:glycosyl transferase family 1 [Candidatus Atribacteria bacterium]
MKRVLLSAYACEPKKGSEPAVGWNTALSISSFVETWVITRLNNKTTIEEELSENPNDNLHFLYFDFPWWFRWWKKGNFGIYLYYYLWQIGIYFKLQKIIKEKNFDIVHHITFANYYKPSFLSFYGIPFIWGPVGGGETAPFSFWCGFGLRGFIFEAFREIYRFLSEKDPFLLLTSRKCSIAFASSEQTAERLSKIGVDRVNVFNQVSLSRRDYDCIQRGVKRKHSKFVFISIGRLLHWKGFHLGIRAFSKLVFKNCEYWIVGDGPQRKNLQKLVDSLGLNELVTFFGEQAHEKTMDLLQSANVLVHPSLHDSGGWVVVESLACGNPVICLNLGGPSIIVNDTCSFKIEPDNEICVIEKIADSMFTLSSDKALYAEMSRDSKIWVKKNLISEVKYDTFKDIYGYFI